MTTTSKQKTMSEKKEHNMTNTDHLNNIRITQSWVMSREGKQLSAARRLAAFGAEHGGIDVPTDLTNTATLVATCQARQREAANALTPAAFTSTDLAADDWTAKLTEAGATLAGLAHVDKLTSAAVDDSLIQLVAVLPGAVHEMADQLEAWFLDHLELLTLAGQQRPGDTFRAADARDATARDFYIVHGDVMEAGGGRRGSQGFGDQARWFLTHTWSPNQWAELVDSTGPALNYPEADRFAHAQRLGAQPRLARSLDQPWNDYVAMKEGRATEPTAQPDDADTEPTVTDDHLKAGTK